MIKRWVFILNLIFSFFGACYTSGSPKTTVYIYHDEGVSQESFDHTLFTFRKVLPSFYTVKPLNARRVIDTPWADQAALFIMPGGADLPYVKKLQGQGNQAIQDYVQKGGAYLGVCAGSYYASSYVEFDKGGDLEVLGKRDLAFFPDKAIGPILAPYDYKSNKGARAAVLSHPLPNLQKSVVYYNGGGYFEKAESYDHVQVLGRYDTNLAAIIHIDYGQEHVVLSGVHFEYDIGLLDTHDPYLKDIIKSLKPYETKRLLLIKEILGRLGIKV